MTARNQPELPDRSERDLVSEILFTTPVGRGRGARYGVAAAAVIVAFSMRYLVHSEVLHRLPFVFFVPAVLVAAWYGGLGPGIAALLGGLILGDYFFLEPHHAWGPLSPAAQLAVGGYTLSSLVGIALFQLTHAAQRRLETRLREQQRARGELPR